LNQFLSGKTNTANQIEFLNLIVDHLVEYGLLDPVLLYRSPYTDIHPKGPEGLFTSNEIENLISLLDDVKKRAVA
jgi:type I restriction enzyme R subunit